MLNVFMTQKLAEMIVFEAEEVMGNNWTDKKLIETADSSSAMIREGIRNLRNFNTSPSFLELNTFAASELIKFSAKNAVYEKLYALSKHVRRSGWSNAAPFFLAISGVPVAKSPFSLEVTPLGNDISFSLKNVSGVDMNNVTILFESKFSELGPELESRQFFCFYDQFEANHDQAFGRQPLMHLLGNGRMPEIKECFVVSVWCDELSSVRNSFDSVAEKRKNKDFPFIPPPTNLRPSKTKAARGKTTAATGSLNRQLILNSSTR